MNIAGQHLCVALSGGVDSVALLCALRLLRGSLGFRLSALHVNHGLSPNADQWQEHCSDLCVSLSVPLAVQCVCVRRDDPRGLEAAARDARYRAFSSVGADCLVLGHHRGDQVETLLHRLLRGAGVRGCGAMLSENAWIGQNGLPIRYLRPLLVFPKVILEQFVREQGVQWISDESNADLIHTRNFLRHQILPKLSQRFPGTEEVLSRATQLFREAEGLLAELAEIDLAHVRFGDGLAIEKLCSLTKPRAYNLVRYIVHKFGGSPPELGRLQETFRQLLEARTDRAFEASLGGVRLIRFDGNVYFLSQAESHLVADLHWRGEGRVKWGGGIIEFVPVCGDGLSLRRVTNGGLFVRGRKGGERISTGKKRPRRSIKEVFSEHRVRPWERAGMPLLWCNGVLIAVGDLVLDPDFACAPGEPGLKLCWHPSDMVLSLQPFESI